MTRSSNASIPNADLVGDCIAFTGGSRSQPWISITSAAPTCWVKFSQQKNRLESWFIFQITWQVMQTNRQSRYASWRALCAALVLLFGAMAAPVALAGSSPDDVCTMACCVAEGYCCCKPRHAFVEGQTLDGKPRIAAAEVAAPCPQDCAAPSTTSPSFARQALRPADHHLDDLAASVMHSPPAVSPSLATACAATAPRAPPARPAHLAN